MSEKEKMLSGKIYNPADSELVAMRLDAQNLFKTYNNLPEEHCDREKVFKQLVPNTADDCEIKGPVYFDYGKFIKLGERVFINYNFTVLDSAIVTIGSNVMIGPNVSLLPPVHPLKFEQRNVKKTADGTLYNYEYSKPITIEDNCWLAGNVTVLGGVRIGEGSVIGAGSVVTKNIPKNSLAFGNPCTVIRRITSHDEMILD